MSFETALRVRLKAEPALNAASVEWAKRLGYPSIRLAIVSMPLGRHMTAFDVQQRPRVQIDVFALDAPVKVTLRDAVLSVIGPAALVGAIRFGRAQEVSFRDMSDEEDTEFVHRDMIEAVLPFTRES